MCILAVGEDRFPSGWPCPVLPGSIYENKWWKGVCVQFIYAVEVRRGNPYFLKSEATRKCKDFHEGPGTECKERGGGGAVCRER